MRLSGQRPSARARSACTTPFVELGGDSLRALALVDAIRDRLRLDLPAVELLAAGTVAEMAMMVASALAGRLPDAARARLLDRSDPA